MLLLYIEFRWSKAIKATNINTNEIQIQTLACLQCT